MKPQERSMSDFANKLVNAFGIGAIKSCFGIDLISVSNEILKLLNLISSGEHRLKYFEDRKESLNIREVKLGYEKLIDNTKEVIEIAKLKLDFFAGIVGGLSFEDIEKHINM